MVPVFTNFVKIILQLTAAKQKNKNRIGKRDPLAYQIRRIGIDNAEEYFGTKSFTKQWIESTEWYLSFPCQ